MQHMIESLPPPRTVAKPSPGSAAERPYVSVSQAASMLGVSRVTIWRWIRAGRLHALRIGHRTIRIDQDQIDCARIQRNGAGIQARQAPVSNAEAAECAPWDLAGGEHVVQFYERDDYLVDSVAALVSGAIAAGDAAIVVATPEHCEGLAARLQRDGLDLVGASMRGQLVVLDAAGTLARLMVDGMADPIRFSAVVGGTVATAVERYGGVRIFGEMVGILAVAGHHAAALRLEELWNDLGRAYRFSLLCGYPMEQMHGEASGALLAGVCSIHGRVIPTESYSVLATEDDRLRAIAVLQQKAQSLAAEIAERQRTEQALQSLLRVSEKLHACLDLETLLDHLVAESLRLVGAEAGCAGLRTSDGMVCQKYFSPSEVVPLAYYWPPGHGLPGWLLEHKVPYLTNDARTDPPIVQALCEQFDVRSALSTPILDAHGEVLGFFEVHNKLDPAGFTPADRERLIGVAQVASVAIQNARLFRAERDAVQVRDVFLSIASHELRTPLTTVKALAQLMLRRSARGDVIPPANTEQAFASIAVQSNKLTRLIDQLLDVTRLEGGQLVLRRAATDIRQVIEQVIAAAAVRTTQPIDLVGPASLIASVDPLRIDQVVTNLLDNAIKYGAPDTPIEVGLSETAARQVEIAVRDRGEGIPEAQRANIFERFFQAHPGSPKGGMGLGLYIGRQIVELHGGEICAEFPQDGGTRIVLRLPASPATPAAASA
jgi:excisionase family DNA binding protein